MFKKCGQILFIKFENATKFHFIDNYPLSDKKKEEMLYRLRDVLSQNHIPYGLNVEGSHNCETLVIYIKYDQLNKSNEVLNFQKKFGYFGTFFIKIFNKIMKFTNTIGYLKGVFEKKNRYKKE